MVTPSFSHGRRFWGSLPLLGPIYSLPIHLWRLLYRRVRPRALLALLALPGCYACLLGPLSVALSLVGGTGGQLGRKLAEISPFHLLGRELFTALFNLQFNEPSALLWLLPATWLTVTVYCSLFLSPLYLWLTARRHAQRSDVPRVFA